MRKLRSISIFTHSLEHAANLSYFMGAIVPLVVLGIVILMFLFGLVDTGAT